MHDIAALFGVTQGTVMKMRMRKRSPRKRHRRRHQPLLLRRRSLPQMANPQPSPRRKRRLSTRRQRCVHGMGALLMQDPINLKDEVCMRCDFLV